MLRHLEVCRPQFILLGVKSILLFIFLKLRVVLSQFNHMLHWWWIIAVHSFILWARSFMVVWHMLIVVFLVKL